MWLCVYKPAKGWGALPVGPVSRAAARPSFESCQLSSFCAGTKVHRLDYSAASAYRHVLKPCSCMHQLPRFLCRFLLLRPRRNGLSVCRWPVPRFRPLRKSASFEQAEQAKHAVFCLSGEESGSSPKVRSPFASLTFSSLEGSIEFHPSRFSSDFSQCHGSRHVYFSAGDPKILTALLWVPPPVAGVVLDTQPAIPMQGTL